MLWGGRSLSAKYLPYFNELSQKSSILTKFVIMFYNKVFLSFYNNFLNLLFLVMAPKISGPLVKIYRAIISSSDTIRSGQVGHPPGVDYVFAHRDRARATWPPSRLAGDKFLAGHFHVVIKVWQLEWQAFWRGTDTTPYILDMASNIRRTNKHTVSRNQTISDRMGSVTRCM